MQPTFEKQKSSVQPGRDSQRSGASGQKKSVDRAGSNRNLAVINEQASDASQANNALDPIQKQKRKRKLNADLLKQFKKHLLNIGFFARLKEIMGDIDCEL